MTPLTVNGSWIQVVGCPPARVVRDLNDSGAHESSGHGSLIRCDLRKAAALIVEEEEGLCAAPFRRERTAQRGAKAVLMSFRPGRSSSIIRPCIRIEVIVEIILIQRAMETVRTALGGHLHLATGGAVEIRSLIVEADSKFLHAFYGRGYNTRRIASGACRHGATRNRVVAIVAVLIAGDVSAIDHEHILVVRFSGYFAARRHGRQVSDEGVRVSAEVRQGKHEGTGHGPFYGCGGCLHLDCLSGDVDGGRNRTDLQCYVERNDTSDLQPLAG